MRHLNYTRSNTHLGESRTIGVKREDNFRPSLYLRKPGSIRGSTNLNLDFGGFFPIFFIIVNITKNRVYLGPLSTKVN